jgi:hypothetical protein
LAFFAFQQGLCKINTCETTTNYDYFHIYYLQ